MIRDERGSATAELAIALPAVVLTLLLGLGALSAGARQVALQDAVADAARLVARGEDSGIANRMVARVDARATIAIHEDDSVVCVTGVTTVKITGHLSFPLHASSCALAGGL